MASAEPSTATNSTTKLFTRAEVAKQNEPGIVLFVIHGSVYDVGQFLNEHPGGPEVLLEQAGDDATEAFEDVGHSTDARRMMEHYKVGELVMEERNVAKEEKKQKDWSGGSPGDENSSGSWRSWLIPVALGVLATLVYRYFITAR